MSESHTRKVKHTCRTVTGTLTALSSCMLVIRAMRPVRIEFGVHLSAAFVVGVANFGTVELKFLILVDGDGLHSRNIGGDGAQGLREHSDPADSDASRRTLPIRRPWLEMPFYTFGLASIEPTCPTAVLYLQLVIPGKCTVGESAPDCSPSST